MTKIKQRWKINSVKVQVLDKEGKVIVPDTPSLEHAIEIEECLNAKRFPNGFESWYETFYEVVAAFYNQSKTPILDEIENTKGRGGMYEYAEKLTDDFELLNKDRVWDGEFFDEIDNYLKDKL